MAPAAVARTSVRTSTTLFLAVVFILAATDVAAGATTSGQWTTGTWTTNYWDCCKPSCAWPGKGSTTGPARSCRADGSTAEPNEMSVCDGSGKGTAGACESSIPFEVHPTVSMGFAAAAVSGAHGLTGDSNCGQCYELIFTDEVHVDQDGYGGAAPSLVGRRHIIQVTNIGYDVTGDHSFDLQVPGAGRGAFPNGCARQYKGTKGSDFDCNNPYGGCNTQAGCDKLPSSRLRAGCRWRYTWLQWLAKDGQTNNPYIKFRRVRCPSVLVQKSGFQARDDATFPLAEGTRV